jgi:hypothetical protein
MAKPDRVYVHPSTSSPSRIAHMENGNLNYANRVTEIVPTTQLEIGPGVYQHIAPDGQQVKPGEPKRLETATMRVTAATKNPDPLVLEEGAPTTSPSGEKEAGLASAKALSESGRQAPRAHGGGGSRVQVLSAPGGAADPSRFFGGNGGIASELGDKFRSPSGARMQVIPTPAGMPLRQKPPIDLGEVPSTPVVDPPVSTDAAPPAGPEGT